MPKKSPPTDWSQVPVLIDIAYATTLLGRSYEHLIRMAINGKLPASKIDGGWIIDKDELRAWIKSCRNGAGYAQ